MMAERFKLEVHVYVLIRNHYHLLIRTREANLSRTRTIRTIDGWE